MLLKGRTWSLSLWERCYLWLVLTKIFSLLQDMTASLHFRKHFYPGVQVPPRSDPWLLPSCILSCILLASPGVSKLGPVGQTEPTPVFVIKCYWDHGHIHSLRYCLQVSAMETIRPTKPKYFIQAFTEDHEPPSPHSWAHVIQPPFLSHEYHLIYPFYSILTLWNAPQILYNLQEPVSWRVPCLQKTVPQCPP